MAMVRCLHSPSAASVAGAAVPSVATVSVASAAPVAAGVSEPSRGFSSLGAAVANAEEVVSGMVAVTGEWKGDWACGDVCHARSSTRLECSRKAMAGRDTPL
jgi:hypothetical protein